MLPLIKIPSADAFPIPQKNAKGTEITIAHGHDVTRKTNPLYNHTSNVSPSSIGIITNSIASITTIGVYIFENFVINFSVFVFLEEDFSIISIILDVVDVL